MKASFLKINQTTSTALFLIISLTSALFYTGNNVWLFALTFLSLTSVLFITFIQRYFQPVNISLNGIVISAVLLLGWFAISIIPSQVKYLTIYNFFWVGSLIIVFLLFILQDEQNLAWRKIWPGILFLVMLWAVYGLVQYYYLHVPTNATFLNRNSLAALVNLALIPATAYFLIPENERPWTFLSNKVLSITLLIFFIATFIITSRGASLSLLAGFIILFFLLRKQLVKSQLYSVITIVTISFSIAYLSQHFTQNSQADFAERMITLKDTSSAGYDRFILWKSLVPIYHNMPWYGIGMGSLWLFWPPYRPVADTSAGYFAHNDYMQFTLEGGYPAIVLLIALFIFILINVTRTLKTDLTKIQRFELVGLFAALVTFAAHSFFTYNFYILPLLIIAGLYLGRIQQLVTLNPGKKKTFPALKNYFKPAMYIISAAGIVISLSVYFLSISFSNYYNRQAQQLLQHHNFQQANTVFIKSQKLAPLMDNPLFSHADMLRHGANSLLQAKKQKQAELLFNLALVKLAEAEKRNPLRPQIFHIRGLIYEKSNIEDAKQQYVKALKLDPRFLFSRIRLAILLHQQGQLKEALQVLYDGVNYTYPTNKVMLEYMRIFAQYSREAGVESFALHLESNIKRFFSENSQK